MQDSLDLRTIFWRNAPVCVRRNDRDETCAELNIRVLAGYSSGTEVLKLVRIYISNDTDPSFLYSLDILEQHYGRVREEEQLLVDFCGFAEKMAWLLHQCCGIHALMHIAEPQTGFNLSEQHPQQAPPSGPPPPGPCRFRAILQIAGASSGALKLVESNAFKDLAHLTLQLRAGTDSSIKQFLAFRLNEVKTEYSRLGAALHDMHAARDSLEAQLKTCQNAAAEADTEYNTQLQDNRSIIGDLESKLKAAQATIESLTAQLTAARAEHAEVHGKAAQLEAEAAKLKLNKSEVDAELAETMAQLQEATARADAAEAAAAQVAQRCQGFEAALRQAEARIEEWKGIAASHESKSSVAAAEISKLRDQCVDAVHKKSALNQQLQEKAEMVAKLEKQADTLQEELQSVRQAAGEAVEKLKCSQAAGLAAENAVKSLKIELDEAKKKVESNDKMIGWLNKQLTAAQLQAGSVARPRPSNGAIFQNSTATAQIAKQPMVLKTPEKAWNPISPEDSAASLMDGSSWPKPRPPLPPFMRHAAKTSTAGGDDDALLQTPPGVTAVKTK